jgi:hypothetical protein
LQHIDQFLGAPVLHRIGVKLLFTALRLRVETPDPGFGAL